MKKIAITTLGCKTNQLESSIIADDFLQNGWQVVKFNEIADIYIINTCTVTGKSDSESRYFVRQAKKRNPDSKIVVTGCYAQVSADEISKIDEIDLIVGNSEKQSLAKLIINDSLLSKIPEKRVLVSDIMSEDTFKERETSPASQGNELESSLLPQGQLIAPASQRNELQRTRAVIKVQDGCNYRCSYCIIPYARGKNRSNSVKNIIEQINNLTQQGFQELVLSGIHLGQWGLDLNPKNSLANLLQEIEQIEELKRFRLSSIDPMEFTDELVNILINSKKFCNHLHISLQSGSNEILQLMRRRYSVEYYTDLINNLIKNIENLAIGSDIIVGFPGETEELFNETYENIKNLPISYLHVFPYSKRNGTPASVFENQVPNFIKKSRSNKLRELAAQKSFEFRKNMTGKSMKVMIELSRDKKTGMLKGLTGNYISVLIDDSDKFKNKLAEVTITEVNIATTKGALNSTKPT